MIQRKPKGHFPDQIYIVWGSPAWFHLTSACYLHRELPSCSWFFKSDIQLLQLSVFNSEADVSISFFHLTCPFYETCGCISYFVIFPPFPFSYCYYLNVPLEIIFLQINDEIALPKNVADIWWNKETIEYNFGIKHNS